MGKYTSACMMIREEAREGNEGNQHERGRAREKTVHELI